MLIRLFQFALSRYVRSPARSWVITAVATLLLRLVRSTVGRRELIDVSNIKPGEMIIIEHLPVTHKQQMKNEKKAKRQARRAGRRWRRSSE
ncbi:MAG: hypothetical protein OER95_01735 [Acidimicrobiia bacterium]|nr:hypothetical protein [Acidimicrobiia bacterium]